MQRELVEPDTVGPGSGDGKRHSGDTHLDRVVSAGKVDGGWIGLPLGVERRSSAAGDDVGDAVRHAPFIIVIVSVEHQVYTILPEMVPVLHGLAGCSHAHCRNCRVEYERKPLSIAGWYGPGHS